MNRIILSAVAIAVASPVLVSAPAIAQGGYNREVRQCTRELRRISDNVGYIGNLRQCNRELHRAQNNGDRGQNYGNQAQNQDWRRYNRYDYNRYEQGYNSYNADRYYRDGRYYADRRMTSNDRIYRGQNGQYYCRRNDGTTGLIIGGGVGALAGNQINLGGSRTVRTIIGGAAGAIIGRQIDRGGMRCN